MNSIPFFSGHFKQKTTQVFYSQSVCPFPNFYFFFARTGVKLNACTYSTPGIITAHALIFQKKKKSDNTSCTTHFPHKSYLLLNYPTKTKHRQASFIYTTSFFLGPQATFFVVHADVNTLFYFFFETYSCVAVLVSHRISKG